MEREKLRYEKKPKAKTNQTRKLASTVLSTYSEKI